METELPNSEYDHVYAIIRLDKAASSGGVPDRNLIAVKKVLRSKDDAEREVQRLNVLNADKGCEYFYQITRLEREVVNQEQASLAPAERNQEAVTGRGL